MATNHVGKLRQCYDTIECHLRSLKALGEDIEHRHFVALITEKLPQKVLYQLYMIKGDEAWTVAKLRELLGKHITALEIAGSESQPQFISVHKTSYHKEFRNPKTTAAELLNGCNRGSSQKFQRSLKCVFCGQGHWSDECPKYATQRARMDKLKGCCFRCLKRGHVGKECPKQRNCFHCGRNDHHRSLCAKLFANIDGKSSESEMQSVSREDHMEKTEGATIAYTNRRQLQLQ